MGLLRMHSELHERLEYLVNYSSQLVFVSGDSIAEQQQTLEAFVYQQHDDTEIAYLTAESNMEISDYRGQLCRQLLGQVVGSFVRPLNELLSALNNHEGPVLIAITQAEHMPDKLLQELWDLVLQSRFAGNKQHLNVLLFATTKWAENAKKWLPTKNTDTPLLISSQSISSNLQGSKPQGSELDRMISQRREAFQAHLDKRNLPMETTPSNPLTSTGFYIAIALVFLLTFGGLVTWQYGDSISSLFSPIAQQPKPSEAESVVPGSAFSKVADSQVEQPIAPTSDNESNVELVTDWTGAVSSLDGDVTNSTLVDSADSADGFVTGNAVEPASPVVGTTMQSSNQEPQQTVISREVANSVPSSNTPDSSASTPAANQASPQGTSVQQGSVKVQEQPLSDDGTTREGVTAASAEILRPDMVLPNDFVIQMVGIKDKNVVRQFIAQHNLYAVTRQYVTTRYGGDWHVVVFHQPFRSLTEARAALSALPDYPTKNEAFIKRGQQILDEMALVAGE